MSLGQKIRELRIARGITQSDLGLGLVTPSMISQIESDKANPSYKVLEAIAARLGTPLEYFLADIQTQMDQSSSHKLGATLLLTGKYERAAEVFESLLDKPSMNLNMMDVKYDLGEAYLHLKRYDESKEMFKAVIERALYKDNFFMLIKALNKIGQLEEEQQRYHLAVYNWRKAYEHFEQLPHQEPYLQSQVLTNLGNVYYKMGEFQESLQCFNEAYHMLANSNHIEEIGFTYISLGMNYKKIREYDKATEYSQYAMAIFESLKNIKMSIDVKRTYAGLRGEDGDYEGALELYNSCIIDYKHHGYELEANAVEGDIARLLLLQRRYEECVTQCEKALSLLPKGALETAHVYRTLGLAQDALGKTDDAIRSLERTIELYQQHHLLSELSDAYSLIAERYEKAGQLSLANESLHHMSRTLKEHIKERGMFL